VPGDDLSSIPGLQDKHVRVLARQQVTDLRGLVHADQRVIYRAMQNLRPRPTLEQIARWQEEARSMLRQAVTDPSDWHTAASFVLVFSQRQAGDTWERRIEAERTEVEPEQDPQVWSGWDCEAVCGWMLGQLDQADHSEADPQPTAEEAADAPASFADAPAPSVEEPAPSVDAPAPSVDAPAPSVDAPAPSAEEPAGAAVSATAKWPAGRAQLHIDRAAIIDAAGPADMVAADSVVANPPTKLVAPVRVVFTVSGARPGTRLQAVTRIICPDGLGWNPQDPVTVGDSGQAEFDLTAVPAGDHEMSLIAWAPDATARPVSLRLPKVTIRTGQS
jgi:hypothetical protein